MHQPLPPFESRIAPELASGLALLGKGRLPLEQPAVVLGILRGAGFAETGRSPDQMAAEGIVAREHVIAGPDAGQDLRIVTYRAAGSGADLPMVLHMHGGGLITGTVESEETTAIRMARECGVLVASVDYRLAPEHPWPAAHEDCFVALKWLHREAAALGGDPDFIAVSGTSAGAGLACALALMSRDRAGPAIAFQVLASPMLDDRTATQANVEFAGIPGWSAELNAFAWTCVLGSDVGAEKVSAYAAPGRAPDLSDLAPAVITLGELELFRDEIMAHATRLAQAGVPVELHLFPGAYHGWERLSPAAEVTRRAIAARDEALRAAISRHSQT